MRRIALASITVGALALAALLAQAERPSGADTAAARPDAGSALSDAGAKVEQAASPPDAGPLHLDGVAPPEGSSPAGFPPDPPPLVTRQQWIVDLAYAEGEVALRGARRLALERPTATPRMMGRFALELYVGHKLLDRVRFDFPMLGAGEYEAKRRWDSPPSFERHATSSAAVMVPNSERATRLVLLDRASGKTWSLPWPPPADAEARPRDAVKR